MAPKALSRIAARRLQEKVDNAYLQIRHRVVTGELTGSKAKAMLQKVMTKGCSDELEHVKKKSTEQASRFGNWNL